MKNINILLSRKRVFLGVLISLAIICYGLWLLPQINSSVIVSHQTENINMTDFWIAVSAIAIGLLCAYFHFKKLFDWKPGLALDSLGITDNSSGTPAGFIPWSEIIGFTVFEIYKQKTLFILLRNPYSFIENANFLKRFMYKANFKSFGSPIGVSMNTLKIDSTELYNLCNKYLENFGKPNPSFKRDSPKSGRAP